MANDYYDFNPSATTWALMLTVVVLFTMALCVLMIVAISRIEASSGRRAAPEQADRSDEALSPVTSVRPAAAAAERLTRPTAAAS